MRGVLVLVLLLTACGGREVPPPSSTDGGASLPAVDAGTGVCRDDYNETAKECIQRFPPDDAGVSLYGECALNAIDAFEWCLGAREACEFRCTITEAGNPQGSGGCMSRCPRT
jgi:hypothetical protein